MHSPKVARNWFDQGGRDYARFRPHYPNQLADFLSTLATGSGLVVDVGCGNGQLTALLAGHFPAVVGVDGSIDQLANAEPHPRVQYLCAPAEHLPLPNTSASLITAAQAAHWFKLPAFYAEVRRVAMPGAVLALISYGVLRLEPELNARFQTFYSQEIGPYWPEERKLVDDGYASIDFPFDEIAAVPMDIQLRWALPDFLGYLQTWSAVRHAREAGAGAVLTEFACDLEGAWGDPSTERPITWPINMRIGRVAG